MSTTPSEHPILFSAPMVRAILAGSKTQTRRLYQPRASDALEHEHGPLWTLPSPYGSPGDRLWVRESFQYTADRGPTSVVYRADEHNIEGSWRPSIHMPRWASRITLELTDLRVQHLHDISDDDARAEGVTPYTPPDGSISPDQRVPGPGFDGCRLGDQPHRLAFADLWDGINGKSAPWASNPWVWAITFRRLP